jgi:hypothetical protein
MLCLSAKTSGARHQLRCVALAALARLEFINLGVARGSNSSESGLIKWLVALYCIGLIGAPIPPAFGKDQVTLQLAQTIPLSGVGGRLDHMAVDLEKKRLFVAAVDNGTLEVC